MDSNKLLELGTRSFALSCSLSPLLHPMQTRLSLFIQLDFKFSTKDLEVLSHFCGVKVLATSTSVLLSQQKYVIDLLSKHNMLSSKPISTLLAIGTSLTANDGTALVNATMYH